MLQNNIFAATLAVASNFEWEYFQSCFNVWYRWLVPAWNHIL